MMQEPTIVFVTANFAKGRDLFDYLKKFGNRYDEDFVYWENVAFTVNASISAKSLLVLNQPDAVIERQLNKANILALMMEPGDPKWHPWMFQKLEQYGQVFSPLKESPNGRLSHGFLGWGIDYNNQEMNQLSIPEKKHIISCIASDLKQLEGHRFRIGFVEKLQKEMPQIDFYGRGRKFLPDKMDGLLPYRYSIAIENDSKPYYFTEKINDCFLAYTVPVYFGCKNIGQFFPAQSFVQIDIHQPDAALLEIRKLIEKNDWEERLDAVKEARRLVLDKYHPLAGAADYFNEVPLATETERIQIKPVRVKRLHRLLQKFQ
ncbi:MAG: hypothetical protein RLZZ28_1840 [Bacteroidota bacterium]|jgi:hypothetical protein